jgi:hypothetical protein
VPRRSLQIHAGLDVGATGFVRHPAAVPLFLGASPRAPAGRCPRLRCGGEKRQSSLTDGGPPSGISHSNKPITFVGNPDSRNFRL